LERRRNGGLEGGPSRAAVERIIKAREDAVIQDRARRGKRLAFAYEFESVLAEIMSWIESRQDAECCQPPGGRLPCSIHHKVDRALTILVRIRQEASLCLGYDQPGRQSQWQDEYYFALAVYGLASAKWPNYEKYWSESALISAGVAAAQMDLGRRVIREHTQTHFDGPAHASASSKRRLTDKLRELRCSPDRTPYMI